MTADEKEELFETLNQVSGNVDQDVRTLTKSLGFYVRFSQYLKNPELEDRVYKIATFLLDEDRPKHNATCIAVSSIIKSCNEPEKRNWSLFEGLLANRTDEYFKIIIAQEAGKLYEKSQLQHLSNEIIGLLIRFATDDSAPVASAAAINTLISIRELQLNESDKTVFKQIGVGSQLFLRTRVIALLDILGLINETYQARVLPTTLFEVELMSSLIRNSSAGIFQELIKAVQTHPFALLCLPRIVFKAILFQNATGVALFDVMNEEFRKKASYYIAENIIESVLVEQDAPRHIQGMLGFLNDNNQELLYKELFLFARASKLLRADNTLPSPKPVEGHDLLNYHVKTEASVPGVILGDLVFPFYRYLHFATDSSGTAVFHEQVNDNELMKVGKNVGDYLRTMNAMMENALTLPSSTFIKVEDGFLLQATIIPTEYQSLSDYLATNSLTPDQICDLLKRINDLVKRCTLILSTISESTLIPIPTLHTVFIHSDGSLIFGLNSLTIGSERRFVGRSGLNFKLHSDRWLVEILGLLLYEFKTSKCAVEELIRSGQVSKDNLSLIKDSEGLVFWSVINKSSQFTPSNRYVLVDYFLKDVVIWAQIQSAFLANPNVLETDKKIVNILWSIEIKIDRIVAREYNTSESLLTYALRMQRRIVDMLAALEVHQAAPFTESWQLISYGKHYDRHLATVQAVAMSERIDKIALEYRQNLSIVHNITFTKWLQISSATIELEALRRSMFYMIKDDGINSELIALTNFLSLARAGDISVTILSSSEVPTIVESIQVFQENLPDLENRLKLWIDRQSDVPGAVWTYDVLLVMFLIVAKYYGIEFLSDSGQVCKIKMKRKLFNATEVNIILHKLNEVFKCDLGRLTTNTHLFGDSYTVSKLLGLNEVNLHIARNLYRCFEYLQVAIHGKLKFGNNFLVYIRSHGKQVQLSQALVMDEIHDHFNINHGPRCAYSIDVQSVNGSLIPCFASFPIVGHRSLDSKLLPTLKNLSAHFLLVNRTDYQRRYPYLSMIFDFHFCYFIGGVLMLMVALNFVSYSGDWREVILNMFIYAIGLSFFTAYFVVLSRRYLKYNSKLATFIKEIN